ncbi:DUF2076 domain-containing protein [Plasticicumulans acidivorans]|uniref:DUF2076 family protein n=1 Tax=Plasticicumulans acidivorans TaxID=886464 RepID=A0A317N2X5_9GAMM|nr:DUF2076 domain-containing protein [Plasticicumulans acidivorans]PWV64497.1 hypothetical protein C7443_102146 [Plasticicumulans acidivorans]
MDVNEKAMIDDLFSRLQQAETKTGPRDAQAEGAIREALAKQPAAPYYMAQAMLVQEHALKQLNERVRQLETEMANRPAGGGGFLSGLFGGGQQQQAMPSRMQPQPGPFQQAPRSSFLGGALQTAAGVAGGMLLGHALMGMFSDVFGDAGSEAVAAAVPEAASDALGGDALAAAVPDMSAADSSFLSGADANPFGSVGSFSDDQQASSGGFFDGGSDFGGDDDDSFV